MHVFETCIVGSHTIELQTRNYLHSCFSNIFLRENLREFLSAIVAVVEENDNVTFFYTTVNIGINERLHKFIGILEVFSVASVAILNGFHHIGFLATHSINELIVSHLHTIPTLVAIHRIETADDASHMCTCFLTLLGERLDICHTALWVGITAVHEAVNISLISNTIFF